MTSPDPAHQTELPSDIGADVEQPGAAGAEEEPEPVLNRAARRAKLKQNAPSHVGPQSGVGVPQSRGGRSHSKRPR